MSQQSALRRVLALIATTTLGMTLAMSAGCDVQSGDEVLRETQINIAGFYTNPEGDRIVSQNTGAKITSLNIMQTGNQLQGIDNNGIIFRGSIGSDSSSEASLVLEGSTTTGQKATITGKVTGSGTAGVLNGTWIEPTLYGVVYGKATIAPITTNSTNTVALAITPSGSVTLAVNSSRTFTASGGSKTYTWTISNSQLGFLSATSGTSVTYSARQAGQQTVTVSDGKTSVSTTVTQQ
ncbi:MAG: hypothetical protein U1F77_09855 [Kiritimatiellia bacterium]